MYRGMYRLLIGWPGGMRRIYERLIGVASGGVPMLGGAVPYLDQASRVARPRRRPGPRAHVEVSENRGDVRSGQHPGQHEQSGSAGVEQLLRDE
jgi:hypothetical protein